MSLVAEVAYPSHRMAGLRGIFGRPSLALDAYLDLSDLGAIHDEICLALSQVPVGYTGGSHRSMGIMPPGREVEAIVDYVEVIRALDDAAYATFAGLADDPAPFLRADRTKDGFGEERELPLSRRQMLWLKLRHRVYFPWKVYVELIPNTWWSEKASSAGKEYTRWAKALLPRTLAFVEKLPFERIGRCNIMGLEANDHGTLHRDGDPREQSSPDHFITFVPEPGKRVYLWDAERSEPTLVEGRAYWFNDHDYHGVLADPWFRYSVRVDGVFEQAFMERLQRDFG